MRSPRRRRPEEARQADHALLALRLQRLGLRGVRAIHVHENRTVLVSIAKRGMLRVHRGYAYAADRVLRAIVTFVDPGATARERRDAERILAAFPVEAYVPARRRRRPDPERPGDQAVLRALRRLHQRFNARYFGGTLSRVRFRLSSRMRVRLGEVTVDPSGRCVLEIAFSRQHIAHDGWHEVEQTLLHEMIHQWQVECGLPLDHGDAFRRKAREVGVVPSAQRVVQSYRRAARMGVMRDG